MAQPIGLHLGHGLPLQSATFISRPNQFTLVLEMNGKKIKAAMADRGRLKHIMIPGRTILVEPRDAKHRKTAYQALAAYDQNGNLVSLDTTLPNRLVRKALEANALEELGAYNAFYPEHTIAHSRFDFLIQRDHSTSLILEIKSVGHVGEDGVAVFPDAPTSRGVKHVQELTALMQQTAHQCGILFIIQGDNATHMEIDADIDPDLHEALCIAHDAGVHIMARLCPIDKSGITLGGRVPVVLDV